MANKQQSSRRQFIGGCSALAASGLVGTRPLRAAASDRMKVAFIGVGGRGGGNLQTITSIGSIDVVAVCDIDTRSADRAGKRFPAALKFQDFRKTTSSATM